MIKILIVGAGFGGLNAALKLAALSDVQIEVVDRRNHHLFQPLLYQVATAGLSPSEIAAPIRGVLSAFKNVTVYLDEIIEIDLQGKRAKGRDLEYSFDYLILACGCETSYFGQENWETHAPGLKTIEQATELRRRILIAFEKAEMAKTDAERRTLLTFVIVGGGPTGVEMAGAIAEISRKTLVRDFRNIDARRARIVLIEAGPRILASFSEELSARATRDLERLGVSVWTSTRVTDVNEHGISFGKESLDTRTLIWAAGVEPSPLNRQLALQGAPLDSRGRLEVTPDCAVKNFPDAFCLGDQASHLHKGTPLPGLAPVAIQQGRFLVKVIQADLAKKPRPEFVYLDKGQMATVGRSSAVVESGRLRFKGNLAWLMWLAVHILYLITFKNKVIVLLRWFWSYFLWEKGARLIVGKEWKKGSFSS